MTVYVLHIEPPYKHARHYIGYTPDATAERRVSEHTKGLAQGSPLIRAALAAGCTITLAHEFRGAGRDFERWLKQRRDTRKWCACCGIHTRPVPSPDRITAQFLARKPDADIYSQISKQGVA